MFKEWQPMSRMKLYWEIPLCISITCIATSLLLAIYDVITRGEVSATLFDDAVVSSSVLLAMAFCAGVLLELSDNHSREADA